MFVIYESDYFEHFGVLGMHWGIHKTEKKPDEVVLTTKLKNGGSLIVTKIPNSGLVTWMAKKDPKYAENISKIHSFTLRDKNGKRIGDASFYQDSPNSLYLDWIGVDSKHRGQGYASATMKGMIKYSQDKGIEKLKLEVPGNSSDARHIYESLGFKNSTKALHKTNKADMWGGLTTMKLTVPQKELVHEDLNLDDFYKYLVQALDEEPLDEEFNQQLIHIYEHAMFDYDDRHTDIGKEVKCT